MIEKIRAYFHIKGEPDITIKEETFLIFMNMGVLGSVVSCIRALIQNQKEVIFENLLILVLCVAIAFACRKRKNIRVCSFILLCLLTSVVFPFLFFRSGGIQSAMPLWFLLIIAVSAAVIDNKFKKVITLLQVSYYVVLIVIAQRHPEYVTGVRSQDQLYIAVIAAFVLVSLSIVLVESYVIGGFEKNVDELKIAKEQANMAARTRMEFLANMSHEIRTPINAIKGLNELSLEETDIEKIKENCRDIQANSELLLGIINDILDFAKLEKGKFKIIEDTYQFDKLLKELKTLENKAGEKDLSFSVDCAGVPEALTGDYVRVSQICYNIISNAIKYTDKGSVSINFSYVDGRLVLNVKDTGRGIKAEDMPFIFDAFERADEKNTTHIEGTGLGLAITKKLIVQMGGMISVDSEYGVGTEFTVMIPQRVGDIREKASSPEDVPDFSGMTILCVDDTAVNLKVIEGFLRKTKAEVVCVDSGMQAIDWLAGNTADVIITDMMMPVMSGYECLNIIRDRGITTPVIALTADVVDNANARYQEMGFDDYLCKPIDKTMLYNTVRRLG